MRSGRLWSLQELLNGLDIVVNSVLEAYQSNSLGLTSDQLTTALRFLGACAKAIGPSLSASSLTALGRHAWGQPRHRGALVQLLAFALREVEASLCSADGSSTSASNASSSTLDRLDRERCICIIWAIAKLTESLFKLPNVGVCAAQLADLLLHTHTFQAVSRLSAAIATAPREESAPHAANALEGAAACVNSLLQLALYAPDQPLPCGSGQQAPCRHASASQRTASSTSTNGTSHRDARRAASAQPVCLAEATWQALADSRLMEHFCRAVLTGSWADGSLVLTTTSNCLFMLGRLAMALRLHVHGQPVRPATLAARDAILSGPCLQYMLAADVISQLYRTGSGRLYGLPVRHLMPRKQKHPDAQEVILLLHMVCTAVPGPMLLQHELRHSKVAAARACMWHVREVLRNLHRPDGGGRDRQMAPYNAVNVLRAALGMLRAMRLGPAFSGSPAGAGDRGPANGAQQALGNDAPPCGGSGGGAGGAQQPQAAMGTWTPGPRLGRRLLEEWWGVAVPLVQQMLDTGLRLPSGVEAFTAEGVRGHERAVVHDAVASLTLELTALDSLAPGLPLGSTPTPNVAAALSAGYVPCLERLMRNAHGATDAVQLLQQPLAVTLPLLLQPLAKQSVLLQLMAYGDVRQVAALVVTAGKLMGRLMRGGSLAGASRRAMFELDLSEDGEQLLTLPTYAPHRWPWCIVEQLLRVEMLPGWHWDKQWLQWQAGGRGPGPEAAGSSSGTGGGSGSSSGSSSGGIGSSGTGAGASSGGPSTSTAAAGAAGAPQLPPPTRQALRLLSLAVVRWTTACLHKVNWAAEQGARPDDVAESATAAMDVVSCIKLCMCARTSAVARGDTRASESWRRVLVHDMGLPGSLGPVLRLLSAVKPSYPILDYAVPHGGLVVARCVQALPVEWDLAVGGAAATTPLWAAVESLLGPNGPNRGSAMARIVYTALSKLRQGAGEPEEMEAVRSSIQEDGARIKPITALLPPPCEAAEAAALSLCANPWCDRLEGDSEAGRPVLRCGGCRAVSYCCRECQAAHWKAGGHKEECKGKGKGS